MIMDELSEYGNPKTKLGRMVKEGVYTQIIKGLYETDAKTAGYLLHTRIRAAIEFLDQLYQYGSAGKTKITELGIESYEEDNTPELKDL